MTKILDDIKNLAREEIDLLNDKVFGISLLESLKFSLIPKLSDRVIIHFSFFATMLPPKSFLSKWRGLRGLEVLLHGVRAR